jgi:hypothetical protein
MAPLDSFTLIGLPYAALVIFLVGTIYRYRATKFSYSSLSSQFLEGRQLFWGTMPFHWGILVLFAGHLAAFLVPKTILAFNSHPVRLLILEVSAFMFGLIVLGGLLILLIRRINTPRLTVVTSRMDLIVAVLLVVEVVIGLSVALGYALPAFHRGVSTGYQGGGEPAVLGQAAHYRGVRDFHVDSLFEAGASAGRTAALHLATLPEGGVGVGSQAGSQSRQRMVGHGTDEHLGEANRASQEPAERYTFREGPFGRASYGKIAQESFFQHLRVYGLLCSLDAQRCSHHLSLFEPGFRLGTCRAGMADGRAGADGVHFQTSCRDSHGQVRREACLW